MKDDDWKTKKPKMHKMNKKKVKNKTMGFYYLKFLKDGVT